MNILDAVSADDVRALPDNTVVEALKRIPGMAVFPSNDNEHSQDESISPAIRGLSAAYNNVMLDGIAIASPGTPNGVVGNIAQRTARHPAHLDDLAASGGENVHARSRSHAVGGAINIVTRSAFEDGGRPFFSMDGALGLASDRGQPSKQDSPGYRLNATGSTTFGANREFGVVRLGNYETISSSTEQHATFDTGTRVTDNTLGNRIAVPSQDRYWVNPTTRSRWGLTGKLEFKPTDDFEAFVMGGYYKFKTYYERNEVELSACAQFPVAGAEPDRNDRSLC